GARVQFVAGLSNKRLPDDGQDVMLRVANGGSSRKEAVEVPVHGKGKDEHEFHFLFKGDPMPKNAGRRVVVMEVLLDAEYVGPSGHFTQDWLFKAFLLAAEDYLLRQPGGWFLTIGLMRDRTLTHHRSEEHTYELT